METQGGQHHDHETATVDGDASRRCGLQVRSVEDGRRAAGQHEPTAFESSIIRARPDPTKADSLFLYYYFNSPIGLHALDTIRRQVAVAGITGTDLSQLPVGVPSLPKQRAIAHVLGTLGDKIELNRRMNETLEAMARALFKSWFVDFDPVRAKMEGRWRRGRSLPGLLAHLYDLFPARLVDSELGEIPEGWEVKALGDCIDVEGDCPIRGPAFRRVVCLCTISTPSMRAVATRMTGSSTTMASIGRDM